MFEKLTCRLFGHPDRETEETESHTRTFCPRCDHTFEYQLTHRGHAEQYIIKYELDHLTPVDEVELHSGDVIEPGDVVLIPNNRANPSVLDSTECEVECLFSGPCDSHHVKVNVASRLLNSEEILSVYKSR